MEKHEIIQAADEGLVAKISELLVNTDTKSALGVLALVAGQIIAFEEDCAGEEDFAAEALGDAALEVSQIWQDNEQEITSSASQ